jgi:EpsD family peptidyl-prolyl cis-trans isomerase
MKFRVGSALVLAGVLAGCNNGPKAPGGQVVATVGEHEITMRDLRAEMNGFSSPDAKVTQAAEYQALRAIIGRDIVADEARKEKLDKSPDFALAKQRATDGLLAQALEQQVVAKVPAATRDDAQRYIDAHPELFAQRKVFSLDQLKMPRPTDPALVKALGPLKTFDQLQTTLTSFKIPYERGAANLDSLSVDPRIVGQLVKLPPGELFVLPQGQLVTVNQIKDAKIVPFTGEPAIQFAQKYVTRERTQQAVQGRLQGLFAAQKDKIKFSKEFAGAAPAITGPGAARAAGPAPAAPTSAAAPTSGGA